MAVGSSLRGYDGTWGSTPIPRDPSIQGMLSGTTTPPTTASTGSGSTTTSTGSGGMSPSQQSAYDVLAAYFKSWGMNITSDLTDIINKMMTGGYSPNDVNLFMPDIENTQAFQQRFPGWAQRVKNGFNQLSDISQYTALEDQYRSIMQSAGLPSGFYDDPSDYANWIANDVSPNEIQTRVNDAVQLAQQVDPTMRNLMSRYYGLSTGDVASYFLDSSRALPTLQRQFDTANVASWAQKAGLDTTDASHYEDLVDKGVTAQQAATGYGTVAALKDTVGKIADVYGDSFTQQDAENDVFFNDSKKRQRLINNEQATFSGVGRAENTGTGSRNAY